MNKTYRGGVIKANGKSVAISFNPGWGEPGEWNISFLSESGKPDGYLTLDSAEAFGSQQKYWDALAYGRERQPEHFVNYKWETEVGNYEDVIRIALEYTGYDDEAMARDIALQNRTLAALKEAVADLSNSCNGIESFGTVVDKVEELSKFIQSVQDEWNALDTTIAVYRKLKDGQQVGCGWTAATLKS
jgi:hypothetical protein